MTVISITQKFQITKENLVNFQIIRDNATYTNHLPVSCRSHPL